MALPNTFERVYAAIKARLRSGHFRPGERLEPAHLAENLNASVTPVRDALHRLTGERLVEAPRHEGFRAPVMTESLLRHLYAWHLDLLLLAVARRIPEPRPSHLPQEAGSLLDRQSALFRELAEQRANPEHLLVFASLAERLEPAKRLEDRFLDCLDVEIAEIIVAIRAGDRAALRRSLVQYHRRRARIVPSLLEEMRRDL